MADTAIVGRLGTDPLAGLALAASVLLFVTALCSFLAYGTTPRLARARGAGDEAGAANVGVQALWLALLLGLPLALALAVLARPLSLLLGGEGARSGRRRHLPAHQRFRGAVHTRGPGRRRCLPGRGRPAHAAGHRGRRCAGQPCGRARGRLRPRPRHRRLGLEHRPRAGPRRRRLSAAHAAPPPGRGLASPRPGRAEPAAPGGRAPRRTGGFAHRGVRDRHCGGRPGRHGHRRRAPGRQHDVHVAGAVPRRLRHPRADAGGGGARGG